MWINGEFTTWSSNTLFEECLGNYKKSNTERPTPRQIMHMEKTLQDHKVGGLVEHKF